MDDIQLVIFDMDGLMIETGRFLYQIYLESAQIWNFEMSYEVYEYLTGRNDEDIRKELITLYGEEAPTRSFRDTIIEIRNQRLKRRVKVGKKKGLLELLNYLKGIGMKIALCSGSTMDTILYWLDVEQIPMIFDIIIDGSSVIKSKPDPEIFLKACTFLNISPLHTIVLEDSIAGVNAALRGEMHPFWIKDDLSDMPNYAGKYKLLKKIETTKNQTIKGALEYESLLEVKKYIETKLRV